MTKSTAKKDVPAFTPYQKFVVALLAFLQFTIILDFMILSPLGAFLMPALQITPSQFGVVVSVYAFSAGAAGILAAGFADKYDRKKLLLFFYSGFVIGTFLCGIANSFEFLVVARIITGLFGGVIGSIAFAITTDLFPMSMRGRVMGFIQSAFAASQILGLPLGLYLTNHLGWHSPFLMIVAVSLIVGILILLYLRPIDGHLKMHPDRKAFHHLMTTVTNPRYVLAFAATSLLSLGGFMIMPFGSAFTVHNLGIDAGSLPIIYLISGIASMFIGPLVGRLSDKFGAFNVFVFGSLFGMLMVVIYTNMGITPLSLVILVNSLMFLGIFSRMIPSQTLMSAVPEPASRGSFMSVSASVQQIAGGCGSIVAGLIVVQNADGFIDHFDVLGYILCATSIISLVLIYFIDQMVQRKLRTGAPQVIPPASEIPV